jgi:hypothetical protein
MQYLACRKTVSILRILLLSSSLFLTPFTRIEAAVLYASPCTLAWNYSPDDSVVGYALYYGITDSGVTNRLALGMTNRVTLYNLLAGANYCFYATTYNAKGSESPPSNPVYYCPRALSALKMTKSAGATLKLQFQAAPGSLCHVEYTPSFTPPRWQTLGNATADANGNVTVSDPLTGSPPSRYYRAVLP